MISGEEMPFGMPIHSALAIPVLSIFKTAIYRYVNEKAYVRVFTEAFSCSRQTLETIEGLSTAEPIPGPMVCSTSIMVMNQPP